MGSLTVHGEHLPITREDRQDIALAPHQLLVSDALKQLSRERRHIGRWGWLWISLLVLGLALAAGVLTISGAIIVDGQVRAGGEPIPVRHESGGLLAAVLVAEGERVQAGAPLLLLDNQSAQARLRDIAKRLDRHRATLARLDALMSGGELADIGRAELYYSELQLLEVERQQIADEAQLAITRAEATQAQIVQLDAQIEAQRRELAVTQGELEGLRSLLARGLTAQGRVRSLERLGQSLQAEIAASASRRAALHGRLTEIAQEQQSRQSARANEWLTQSHDLRAQLAAIEAQKMQDELAAGRLTITAPASGIVTNMVVRKAGTVIGPNETLMNIVTDGEAAMVEAFVPSNDIDEIAVGQKAEIDLSPLDPIAASSIPGTITRISADTAGETQENRFYRIEVELPAPHQLELRSGAPVRVLLPTAQETLLSRLLSPLHHRLNQAWRER